MRNRILAALVSLGFVVLFAALFVGLGYGAGRLFTMAGLRPPAGREIDAVFTLLTTAISLVCAGIFAAAFFKIGYYFRLDAYAPAILCVLLSLNFVVNYYRTLQRRQLLFAGLATGLVMLFSYDVGVYTTVALAAGLLLFHGFTISSQNRFSSGFRRRT